MPKKLQNILLVSTGYSPANELDSGKSQLLLGHLYLATVLNEKGYNVELYSDLFPEPESFLKYIEENHFQVVGFYSTTNTIYRVKTLADLVKEKFPEILVFLGGPHPTLMDCNILEECHADLIMRHEGEETFPEVMEYFSEGKGNPEDIKGITYRKDDKIFRNENREFIKNLDKLPIPDWTLLKGELAEVNHKYPSIMTGRGCPFKCAFCFEGFSGTTYRLRSAENVMKEIDLLLNNWEVKYIKFVDDTFVVDSERVKKICAYLNKKRKEKYNFHWFCEARVDIMNKRLDLLEILRDAGLAVLQIGVESGNQHILDLYDKRITLEEIENVVSRCVDADIFCISVNVIIGGPFESPMTIKNTTEFIKKLIKIAPGRLFCQTSLLTPYPATTITENPKYFGLKNIDPLLKDGQTEETCFMESEEMNRFDIYRVRMDFDRDIYEAMIKEFENIPPDLMEKHFYFTEYGIKTPWYDIITSTQAVNRYFNLKSHSLYRSIKELKPEEIEEWCPFRTYPIYYEDSSIVLNGINTYKLSEEETIIYELSSGKLNFKEISDILSKKLKQDYGELKSKMIDFYKKMDSQFAVIFSRL